MSVLPELLNANEQYAATFTKGDLPMPPARNLVVLTCMDARLDPEKFLGLEEGDAHVIRNAGGRATEDVLRSLAISQQLLGTTEVVIIHHTDCGMLTFTNEQLRDVLAERLGIDAGGVDFLPFTDLEQSVRDDVSAVRDSALIPGGITVSGLVYDVNTGRLTQVE